MKKMFVAVICLLSIVSYSQSKKFVFKLGDEYKPPRNSEDLSFFGNERVGIVNLTLKKDELSILRFNSKSLALSSDKQVAVPDATSNLLSEEVVEMGGNCYWVHSDWDRSARREKLSYDVLDIAGGKISKSGISLIESDKLAGSGLGVTRGRVTHMIKTGKYEYNYDAEHKNLLVSYRIEPAERNDKKNYDRIGLYVFDSGMAKLWGNEFTMPYTEAVMDNEDYSIDVFGNAYILAKVYESDARKEVDKETGKPGYHFELLKYGKGAKKPQAMPVVLGEYFVRNSVLIENPQHEMIIASTYSKKSKGLGIDGVFLAAVNSEGQLVPYKKGYYEFPLDEMKKFESAKAQRKMDKKDDYEASNLRVRDVLVGTDASVLISLEEYRVVTRTSTSTSGGMTTTSSNTTYYYEDIYAMRINNEGTVDWMRKIPKRQSGGRGIGTMSFKLVSDETGYYFLYLDNLKNIQLAEDEVPAAHSDGFGGQVMVTKIDKAGKVKKDIVFDTREEEVMIFPSQFSKISGNQFIGRAQLKKNLFRPLLITVK
jgi:hypothetical protein